jgi:hypothetical protein
MAGLTTTTTRRSFMAKSFKPIGAHAINVLARLAAKTAVKEQMRGEGIRMTLVPPRVVTEKANAYLQQHPELYEQALERAKQMGLLPPIITPDRPV